MPIRIQHQRWQFLGSINHDIATPFAALVDKRAGICDTRLCTVHPRCSFLARFSAAPPFPAIQNVADGAVNENRSISEGYRLISRGEGFESVCENSSHADTHY